MEYTIHLDGGRTVYYNGDRDGAINYAESFNRDYTINESDDE